MLDLQRKFLDRLVDPERQPEQQYQWAEQDGVHQAGPKNWT
jgi:hypothetical protein